MQPDLKVKRQLNSPVLNREQGGSAVTKLICGLSLWMVMAGCAMMPTGPSVLVLPTQGKTFDQFSLEDARCRQWASQQLGLSPQERANMSMAGSTALGTALGAGLGAAIGAATGHPGTGAAIGAGGGLLVGSSSGGGAGEGSARQAQRQYDIYYQQCMYAFGNQLPGVIQAPPATP